MKAYHKLKAFPFFIFLIVFLGILSYSSAQQKQEPQKGKTELKKDSVQLINKNISNESNTGPGCPQGKGKGCCRMKDKFIDKDNDGINDNRCKGIGFGKQHKKGKCKNRGCKANAE